MDKLIEAHDVQLLASSGQESHRQMEERVNDIYTAFDARRKKSDAAAADREDLAELEADTRLISLEKK